MGEARHGDNVRPMNTGILQAALAYVAWGLMPLYFRAVSNVAPFEIVLHRTLGALVFVFAVLAVLHRFEWLRLTFRSPRRLLTFGVSALLLSGNWLLYVWAVNNGHVIDSSLGYFINPLVYVLLGYFVLHERPRSAQWLAIALAASGVVWLTVQAGTLPWIALLLAGSFGVYGLMRKTAALGAIEGLALETLLLAPVAAVVLAIWTWQGGTALADADPATLGWLLLAGPLTAVPLLLFAAGARRIPLATLGLLQYVGPTLQFGLGILLFREPFDRARFAGFTLIWTACALYSAESWWRLRRAAVQA
jgi:chloramphenicol-sensitive protein RarD